MARDGAHSHYEDDLDPPRRRGMLGLWAAAIFNICCVALPLAGSQAVHLVERERLYSFEATPAAARAARVSLERLSARLVPADQDRRDNWDNRVAAELMDNDIAAARGVLLSARTMLPGSDAAQVARGAADDNRDADIEMAALALLTPGTRSRYEAAVPLLSRRAREQTRREARPFATLGDGADFGEEAQRVLSDPDAAHLPLVLRGLGVVLRTQVTPDALLGAAVVLDGLERDRLAPSFTAALSAQAQAALPRARFAAEATRRAGAATGDDPLAIYDAAFRAALQPEALQTLTAELERIGAVAVSVGSRGALTLLSQARSLEDVRRAQLLATTNPDRAIALAKRLPRDGAVMGAAPAQLTMTPALVLALGVTALAGLGLALTATVTAAQAVMRLLNALDIIRAERPKPPPRADHRLVREIGSGRRY